MSVIAFIAINRADFVFPGRFHPFQRRNVTYNVRELQQTGGDLLVKSVELKSISATHSESHTTTDSFLIHTHSFYEIYYFISGDVQFLHHGAIYAMQPHSLLLIAPNVFHGVKVLTERGYERYALHFSPDALSPERRLMLLKALPDTSDRNPEHCVFQRADRLGILSILLDFDRLSGTSEDRQAVLAPLLVEEVLCRLLLHSESLAENSASFTRSTTSDTQVQPVLDYIHLHLTEKLSLDFLCDTFYFSKSTMNAMFREHTGTTCMDYVRTRRLQYARQLLLSGATSEQAGSACGFSDYTAFYRAYTKLFGHPPSRDRQPSALLHADSLRHVRDSLVRDPDDEQETIWQRHPAVTFYGTESAPAPDPG